MIPRLLHAARGKYRPLEANDSCGLRDDTANGGSTGVAWLFKQYDSVAATDKSGADYFVRADLTVLTKNETEIVAGIEAAVRELKESSGA